MAAEAAPIVYFVESLTLWVWFVSALPRLLARRMRGGQGSSRCYVFDGSPLALAVARACARFTGVPVEPLDFRMLDVRDERGLLLRLRIAYQDLADVQAEAMQEPAFRAIVEGHQGSRLPSYLAKVMATISPSERQTLWRALLTIQVCRWKARSEPDGAGASVVFFLERRLWLGAIARYASRHGVAAVPVQPSASWRRWVRRRLTPELTVFLRWLRSQWLQWTVRRAPSRRPGRSRASLASARGAPRLGVEYYGHLNLNGPARYSDLFFWQQSSLPAEDVLVTFNIARDPLDERKWAELTEHGFSAVALDPQATAIEAVPVFTPRPRWRGLRQERGRPMTAARTREGTWLRYHARQYRVLRAGWEEFFSAANVKLYVSWMKFDALHCAVADALQAVGGIFVSYQRSFESHPSAECAAAADVMFGFSAASADVERLSGSRIGSYVITGYLGDHRFAPLRSEAARVRRSIQSCGATRIVAFADENSADDARWHTGHEMQRQEHAFFLERVLQEPWFGLIVKPKVPSTLRRRLGPVAELLRRAEATGRCFVYDGGALHSSVPPALAALAADVMVHGHLCAGTAGLESALAGVPTLLMDREGWSISPFYRLGVGRVVFTDWPSLWAACLDHWKQPRGVPGFGDWSPLLEELDPFRDGRAAERMGTYLLWLLEGFRAGLPRETVMADAAERYSATWGQDKVVRLDITPETWADSRAQLARDDGVRLATRG